MRRILVTGANKGIGLAIARAILEEHDDTFVYLGSRDAKRGQEAAASLPSTRVLVVPLDVADDHSVAAAREQVATHAGAEKLYAIVNNAGIGSGAGASLAEVLATNTRGVRRVCEAFLPLVAQRIVNVTSASGPMFVAGCGAAERALLLDPTLTWPRLDAFLEEQIAKTATGKESENAYGLSKAAANAYTQLLARAHPDLRINACTPGFIETDMTRHYAASQGKSAAELGMKSPADGAKAPMFLLFGDPPGNGRYYGSDAKRSPLDRYRAPGAPEYQD